MAVLGIRGASRGMYKRGITVSEPLRDRHPDCIRRRWDDPSRPDQCWAAGLHLLVDYPRRILLTPVHRRCLFEDEPGLGDCHRHGYPDGAHGLGTCPLLM